jgi:hypothetical protein
MRLVDLRLRRRVTLEGPGRETEARGGGVRLRRFVIKDRLGGASGLLRCGMTFSTRRSGESSSNLPFFPLWTHSRTYAHKKRRHRQRYLLFDQSCPPESSCPLGSSVFRRPRDGTVSVYVSSASFNPKDRRTFPLPLSRLLLVAAAEAFSVCLTDRLGRLSPAWTSGGTVEGSSLLSGCEMMSRSFSIVGSALEIASRMENG